MRKRFLLSLLIILIPLLVNAQVKQRLHGVVTDKQSGIPLSGVTVFIEGSNPLIFISSDDNGEFDFPELAIGKVTVVARLTGYDQVTVANVVMGSGKQTELNLAMQENTTLLGEIVVTSRGTRSETVNSMSAISGRAFSVEETQRYAGGLSDPARMVSAFAGVSTGNMQDNAIIIRGNSPKYVSWQLEGVEITNPNHFSNINVIGGGFVTIFSNQLLSNSDFLTGAFAAEYGNALSGVFDMRLRSGNTQKREYTFQAGTLGIDFAAEGPFTKGTRASYLVNYRYSTMSLITALIPSKQVPEYQDLSLNLTFPTKKAGTFSLWGISALDKNLQPENNDSTKWDNEFDRFSYTFSQRTGTAGLSHKMIFGTKTFINSTLAATANEFDLDMKRFNNQLILDDNWHGKNMEGKLTFKSFINHKSGERHTNRTGIIVSKLFYSLDNKAALNNTLPVVTLSDETGNAYRIEAFTQSQLKIGDKMLFNCGLHSTWFELNNEFLIEPRLNISYDITKRQRISIGYGNHSTAEPLFIYFYQVTEDGTTFKPNKNLRLTKGRHIIAGYDLTINEHLRFRAEPYIQLLYDVPVVRDSVYSMINFEQDFHFSNTLINEGKGTNVGIDLTFEKYYDNSFYFLVTMSLFKSDYSTGNGKTYPTRYDKGYVINLLGGKDFVIEGRTRNTIGINGRLTVSGGNRTTPVNLELSEQKRSVCYDWSKPFSDQNPTDFYADLTVNWRRDSKRTSSIFSLQIKNILGTPTGYNWTYNYREKIVEQQSVVVVLPNISYRLEF